MPVITFNTNLAKNQEFDTKLALGIANLVPECFNKGSDRAQVIINSGLTMIMGGTDDPCGQLKILSIGAVTPDMNKNTCKIMTEFICAECKMDP